MKIIATTAGGMLVEMSRSELIEVSGHDPLVRKLIENRDWSSPIGATFSVGTAWHRLRCLRDSQEQAHRSAATLRALADLLEGQLNFLDAPAAQPEGAAPPEGGAS